MITMEARDKKLILGGRTQIMGILNVTPDSFSDGGRHNEVDDAIIHAKAMILDGADIIDVGGESTRPGAEEVTEDAELKRVIPVIERLKKETGAIISIDSYKAKVAEAAMEAGAHIINDVWGLQREPDIAKVAAEFDVPVIAMHNQVGTEYTLDIIDAMKQFFHKTGEIALKAGVKEEKIILDPGIGFGKTPVQNIEVMGRLKEIRDLGYPVLLGTSRKSMIGYILDLPADERLEGTLATSVIGIQAGCEIIRVHDVKENLRTVMVTDAILKGIY